MLLEIENVFVTPAGEVCADAAGQRSRQGAEEPQQPESVSGNVSFMFPEHHRRPSTHAGTSTGFSVFQ